MINNDKPITEEYLVNAIKNISETLSYIYQKKALRSDDKSYTNNQIQEEINNLVDNMESFIAEREDHIDNSVLEVVGNNTLLVSEKENKVYLPYNIDELKAYMLEYPEEYKTLSDVVNQEYIVPLNRYHNSAISRFREVYYLMRDIEMRSILESFKRAVDLMFNARLNPIIISACKSEEQLTQYVYCAEHNCLEDFTAFKIEFEVAPLSNYNYRGKDRMTEYIRKTDKRNKGKHS